MLKEIILGVCIFSSLQQVSARELDQVSSVEVLTSAKLRGYADAGKQPESATAFSQNASYPSCQLMFLPALKVMDSRTFNIVGTEPKYDGGLVEIYGLKQNRMLKIVRINSQVNEKEQECALPSHPELCDQNPPMVKSKSTDVDLTDAQGNRWLLLCNSEEILSEKGITPKIEIQEVIKSLGSVNLK